MRVLAGRNAFLIETDENVSLEAIKLAELPVAELGETDGVKWLHQKMPGDVDYAGMEYAVAVAGKGRIKAVSTVTSWDTKGGDVRDCRHSIGARTAAADPASLIADTKPNGRNTGRPAA